MSVSVKLGNGMFNKESRIAELERQVSQLQEQNKLLSIANTDYETRFKQNENKLFEMSKIYQITVIETQQMQAQIKKQQEVNSKQTQEMSSNQQMISELQHKLKEMMNHSSSQKDEIIDSVTLCDRLKQDLRTSEDKQLELQKQIEQLYLQREQQLADNRVLQKNLQQKDKFIAILQKERDKEKENSTKLVPEKKPEKKTPKPLIDGLDQDQSMMSRLKNKRLNQFEI